MPRIRTRTPTASASLSYSAKKRRVTPPREGAPMQILQFDPGQRKPRKRTHKDARHLLEAVFVDDPKPERGRRDELVRELGSGWTQRDVQVWFQNRRAKSKRLDAKATREGTSASLGTSNGSSSGSSSSPGASASPKIHLTLPKQSAPPSAEPQHPQDALLDEQSTPAPASDYCFPFGPSQEPPTSAAHHQPRPRPEAAKPNAQHATPPLTAPTPTFPLDYYRRGSMPALPSPQQGDPPGFSAGRRLSADPHTLSHVHLLCDHPWAHHVLERNGELSREYGTGGQGRPSESVHPDPPLYATQQPYSDQLQYPGQEAGPLPELDFKFGAPPTMGGLQDQFVHEQAFVYAPNGGVAKEETADEYTFLAMQAAAASVVRHGSIASNASTLFSDSSGSRRSSTSGATDEDPRRASVSSATGMFAGLSLRGHAPMANSQPPSSNSAYNSQPSYSTDAAHAWMYSELGLANGAFASMQDYSSQNVAGPSSHYRYSRAASDAQAYAPTFHANGMASDSQGLYPDARVGEEGGLSTPRPSQAQYLVPLVFASYQHQFNTLGDVHPQPAPPIHQNLVQAANAIQLPRQCVIAQGMMEPDPFAVIEIQPTEFFGRGEVNMGLFP